jgi:hypothetical protein
LPIRTAPSVILTFACDQSSQGIARGPMAQYRIQRSAGRAYTQIATRLLPALLSLTLLDGAARRPPSGRANPSVTRHKANRDGKSPRFCAAVFVLFDTELCSRRRLCEFTGRTRARPRPLAATFTRLRTWASAGPRFNSIRSSRRVLAANQESPGESSPPALRGGLDSSNEPLAIPHRRAPKRAI